MEDQLNRYKKLYRFAAPVSSKSFMGYFVNFMEKSNKLPSIKLNVSVKKEILNLEVYCNTNRDFEFVKKDIFDFFKLSEIKNFFMRYYDLENGKFIINPSEISTDNSTFHIEAQNELFRSRRLVSE